MRTNIKRISKHNSIYTLCTLLLIGVVSGAYVMDASALTYQKSTDVKFTVNPSVSISLSSTELNISDLTPGAAKDSNIITLTVESNNSAGYTVKTTVGNSTYDTTNLKHTDNSVSDVFTSLTSAGGLSAGKWGYSYATESSDDNWTNWSTYNGLPKYNDTEATPVTLIDESSAASNTIAFKIGAQANSNQASGEYNNVINFIAVVTPVPSKLYMQNATSADCGQIMYDNRDDSNSETAYTTATINGLCWMTTNLNLAGGTQLSNDNTNVPKNYTTSITGFTNGNTLPPSSTSGFDNGSVAYVYNSGSTTCGNNQPCYSYYSWYAANAGYPVTVSSYDICPKGWRLPSKTELTALVNTYSTAAALTADPFSATYGYYGSSEFIGTFSGYFSSNTSGMGSPYYLYLSSYSNSVGIDGEGGYGAGYSVRCVLNT